MKEGYSDKSLESILQPHELRFLIDLMDHPGWPLLDKINRVVAEDWIHQTATMDFSSKDDEEMKRVTRTRSGMIKGISLLLSYLEKKKIELAKKAQ